MLKAKFLKYHFNVECFNTVHANDALISRDWFHLIGHFSSSPFVKFFRAKLIFRSDR